MQIRKIQKEEIVKDNLQIQQILVQFLQIIPIKKKWEENYSKVDYKQLLVLVVVIKLYHNLDQQLLNHT